MEIGGGSDELVGVSAENLLNLLTVSLLLQTGLFRFGVFRVLSFHFLNRTVLGFVHGVVGAGVDVLPLHVLVVHEPVDVLLGGVRAGFSK